MFNKRGVRMKDIMIHPILAVCCLLVSCGTSEDPGSWAGQIAASFMARHPDGIMQVEGKTDTAWTYEQGLMLEAFRQMGRFTGEQRYDAFIRKNLRHYVGEDGSIRSYRLEDYNLDMIAGGRALLHLLEMTKQDKYRIAADLLRSQLKSQPRTHEGGFWHKKIYPYQMWLDGLFMAQPFAAWYISLSESPEAFDDIANQFVWVARHTYDEASGLFYHAWDESRTQRWADPATGRSPNFWGRAIGWYAMGLADVLDYFPRNHPRRPELVGILKRLAEGIIRYQDPASGLWYQVVDQAARPGNYREASASAMLVYSFAKGVNQGYLDSSYLSHAEKGFRGILDSLVTVDEVGLVTLRETCRGAGLGGQPYRDGSFEYYVSEPRRLNDMKGYGAFLRAAIELERGRSEGLRGNQDRELDTR